MKIMGEIGLRSRMLVKDVMSNPVVTVEEHVTVNKIAKIMKDNSIGCIIVTSKEEKPLGIITERDLVERVLTKNVKPDSVKAEEIMSTPLTTIEPDITINEAARKMNNLNVRRLGVIYKGRLVGLISSKDILAIMPELIEIIQEKTKMEYENAIKEIEEEGTPLVGYCDRCRSWSDRLTQVNGDFICEDCKLDEEE